MSIDVTDPLRAPMRIDLPYLRRRVRAARVQAQQAMLAPGLSDDTERGMSTSGSPLDLTPSQAPLSLTPARTHRRPVRLGPRLPSDATTVLSPTAPMIVLNRLQSGIGHLDLEVVWSGSVGDLRLGCTYALTDGQTSTVRRGSDAESSPRNAGDLPVVTKHHRFERLIVDARQSPRLARLIVYGYSESGRPSRWDGLLVATTFGGTRIELPIDRLESGRVAVLMSVYNVDGEFVIRAEMETIDGTVRDACQAYGFERVTWIDGNSPAR